MKSPTEEQLFTEITTEEAASINGGGSFIKWIYDIFRRMYRPVICTSR
ncbi:hypothetical protein [Nostoc sp.]